MGCLLIVLNSVFQRTVPFFHQSYIYYVLSHHVMWELFVKTSLYCDKALTLETPFKMLRHLHVISALLCHVCAWRTPLTDHMNYTLL